MARRVSRRKMPDRDIHQVKEEEKTDTGIFNDRTMMYLSKFYNKGVVEKIDFPIAKGKEADIYLAEAGSSDLVNGTSFLALKFFRIETSSFYKMRDYIEGDIRFGRVKRDKRSIVLIWCRKEFGNLRMAYNGKVSVPQPYMCNGSILAMEFVGENGKPAPRLKEVKLENPKKMFGMIIRQMALLYKTGLVHADMSEYNILVKDDRPYIIDMGQAVILKHPNAMQFLERDVRNVCAYFSARYGINSDTEKMLGRVTGNNS